MHLSLKANEGDANGDDKNKDGNDGVDDNQDQTHENGGKVSPGGNDGGRG